MRHAEVFMENFVGDDGAPNFEFLATGVRAGSRECEAELYQLLRKSMRYVKFASRLQGGVTRDDLVHEVFVIVLTAMRAGKLRDSSRLMGFVRTIAVRVATKARMKREEYREDDSVLQVADQMKNAEESLITTGKVEGILRLIRHVTATDRELLERFYFKEEHPGEIREVMRLSLNQFRNRKSRALKRIAVAVADGAAGGTR